MANIVINNRHIDQFSSNVKSKANDFMMRIFKSPQMQKFLFEQSNFLTTQLSNSSEWSALHNQLIGEFGFTPEEVSRLNEILPFIETGSNISKVEISVSTNRCFAVLQWVDFEELKNHPLAQHALTRRGENIGSGWDIISYVSWIDWLENGETIEGYSFIDKAWGAYSRSGKGIMKKGGLWQFEPTHIFEQISSKLDKKQLEKGLGVVLRSKGQGVIL